MLGNEGKHHSCHAGWSPAAKSCQADPGHSSQWCSSDSWLSLCFFLLFWGIFLMFWSSAILCHLLVSCRVRVCFGLTWVWGPRARSCPWDVGMCHLIPTQSLSY